MTLRDPIALVLVLVLAASSVACGDDSTGTGGAAGTGGASGSTSGGAGGEPTGTGGDAAGTGGAGTGGDGLITTECGTFDPNQGGDSVIPDDPADPEIVASCEAFCDAFAEVCDNGGFFRDDCIDDCRMRACGICPGTIQPLVDCETAESDVATCGCQDGVPVCQPPDACDDLRAETGFCGG